MKAFLVELNGARHCVAAAGNDEMLSVYINLDDRNPPHSDGFTMYIGAIDHATGQHIEWQSPAIGVGDEIAIRLIETDRVDVGSPRFSLDE